MFINIDFKTVNKITDISSGIYSGNCIEYLSKDGQYSIALCEYSLESKNELTVVDIIITDLANNENFILDIVKMKDSSWRDCHGNKSDNVISILPNILKNAKQVMAYKLKNIVVS